MTNQEAIETIKLAMTEVEWEYQLDYAVAFDKAIKALEKQIPKKPIYKTLFIRLCPACGEHLCMIDHPCRCGQMIDWSEADL